MTDSPSASRASFTPPVDSTREMAATRLGQVTQKLVGISRVRSFSITLGSPKGQRAATRNGRGARPSCRATASRSLELSAISYQRLLFSPLSRPVLLDVEVLSFSSPSNSNSCLPLLKC